MESPLRPDLKSLAQEIELIETFDPASPRRSRHLARMARSALAFGLAFAPAEGERLIAGLGPCRARLSLTAQGLTLTTAPLPPPAELWRAELSPARLTSTDPLLRHKTNRRAAYDSARAGLAQGSDEAILLNERGELCEGSITSLFVPMEGRLATPPLRSGLLPGILREELLETGRAFEKILYPQDLAGSFYLGNSLRGLIPARLRA